MYSSPPSGQAGAQRGNEWPEQQKNRKGWWKWKNGSGPTTGWRVKLLLSKNEIQDTRKCMHPEMQQVKCDVIAQLPL